MIREYQRKPKKVRAVQVGALRKAGAFVGPYKDCPDSLWLIQEPDGTERKLADDKFREEYEPSPMPELPNTYRCRSCGKEFKDGVSHKCSEWIA